MKKLKWLLGWFYPFEEGESESEEQQQSSVGDAGQRPPDVPEKFWDPDIGVRTDELVKGYNELEGKMRTKTDDLRVTIESERLANVPETYEFAMPDDVKIPDGIEMDLNPEDPLLQWFNGYAKSAGLSQDQYNDAIKAYVELEVARMPDLEAEISKLGENGRDRITAVNGLMDDRLEPDEKAIIAELLTTAAGVSAMEKLLKISGPENFEGDPGGSPLSLEELKKIQAMPEYYRDHDPELIKKVEAGYARLYGGQ